MLTMKNLQYDYDYGPTGPLAALQERSEYPEHPGMISPPVGWVDLVVQLDADLATLIPDYTITQVKEKFAGLRYYIGSYGIAKDDPRMDLVRMMIDEAETLSRKTCQVCGGPGKHHNNTAWMITACNKHAR